MHVKTVFGSLILPRQPFFCSIPNVCLNSLVVCVLFTRTVSSGSGEDVLPVSPPTSCGDPQVDQMFNVMDTAFNHGSLCHLLLQS